MNWSNVDNSCEGISLIFEYYSNVHYTVCLSIQRLVPDLLFPLSLPLSSLGLDQPGAQSSNRHVLSKVYLVVVLLSAYNLLLKLRSLLAS